MFPSMSSFHTFVGTGHDWLPCPAGTFSDQEGLQNETQCQPCPGGRYCAGVHQTVSTGDCDPGYWCESGVDRPNPGQVGKREGDGGETLANAL